MVLMEYGLFDYPLEHGDIFLQNKKRFKEKSLDICINATCELLILYITQIYAHIDFNHS